MLVYRKYSYTDGPGLYTVTSVATRYLQVYTRNQHGWFSSGTIRGLIFYTPVENGTYYGMAMSVRFSILPSVTLTIMTVSVHFLIDG
jgi:hypothetical protein